MRSRVLAVAVLACLLAWALPAQDRDINRLYRQACDRLICQCGCNEQLSVCSMQNCSSATPMRAEVRERLQKGETIDQIVESFVQRMGPKVLSAPTTKGFDLTAWVMPFLALCLGIVVVGWIVVKMVRPAPSAAGAAGTGGPAPVDPRVEKELREFEEES
jgi:cytochrome c-type biogenesis protein CcmH